MLSLLIAFTLTFLAYLYFSDPSDETSPGTGTPTRLREPTRLQEPTRPPETADRQGAQVNRGPQVHRRKVEGVVEEEFERAQSQAGELIGQEGARELAWESHFLFESTRRMFSHDEFFGSGRRFGSFEAAIKAARGARERLISKERGKRHQKEMTSDSGPNCARNRYVKSAVESALVIGWCAGGLIGKSKCESARVVFPGVVSARDVSSWDRFAQVLREERDWFVTHPEEDPLEGVYLRTGPQ